MAFTLKRHQSSFWLDHLIDKDAFFNLNQSGKKTQRSGVGPVRMDQSAPSAMV